MAATRVLLTALAIASAAVAPAQSTSAPSTNNSTEPARNPFRAYGPVGLPSPVRQASFEEPIVGDRTPAALPAEPPLPLPTDDPVEARPAEHPLTPVVDDAAPALPSSAEPSEAEQARSPVPPPLALDTASVGQTAVSTPLSPPPASAAADNSFRRLAPPTPSTQAPTAGERPRLLGFDWNDLPVEPATSAAALGLVVGLFLLTAAVFKRAAPKSQRLLPGEVGSLLGRISLGGKQSAHLLKVGSKLVLVHITPDGAKPLTEVTDPAEVNRLLGLCEQGGEHSASTAFADVFEKLAAEPATPGFLGAESSLVNRQELAAAYANTPGGRGGR
ncbi:Flagellar biosynthesis protein, FliO [Posidoniimonas polymericola]|uniref:Flagellar biosynthesis protein, FliO n=1 Tax=Posidoniimonas polymericola TaxID=2528002 RepID=A0A5C5YR46_9BACT|nr:flagellar biosynthetic protein FliO [Posidoniimonas polymericola]TWT77230.1 Flagellar biosynthesis protein, FliO [Posidoniimonas polymericola]